MALLVGRLTQEATQYDTFTFLLGSFSDFLVRDPDLSSGFVLRPHVSKTKICVNENYGSV